MKPFIEILGWYGAIAILAAYALVSFGELSPQSLWYHILNGTGALAIATHAFVKKDYQPALLNVIWMLIAIFALAAIAF